ncbi:tyrosine-type recombinase/integrase [Ideonella margarita]|uniref:Integrase arm-type DNA-binding domain-containing protein n=1 Tax=Ideonella margarita TaxID=2984191 RepID=A0ABU9C759_9BURK
MTGLYLYVNEGGGRSWVLRTMVGSKRRHIGLGGFPDVPLAAAKERARQLKLDIAQGRDPVEERRAAKHRLVASQVAAMSFQRAAERYIEAHGDSWKSDKHRAQWVSTLVTYAYPVIGVLDVKDVAQQHVLEVLEPIWKTKNETASRLRGRIEVVLDWASVRGHRSGENPARWKGHLDKLLPAPGKIHRVEHHRAMPIEEVSAFMLRLAQHGSVSAMALTFLVLTAGRSGEVRGATWSEIDFENSVWTVPADRMKAGKEHRVPLSDDALRVLNCVPRVANCDCIFPSTRGGPLSDMALTQLMRRMGVDAVPHGFRSTFRDWAGEKTNYPREVAEMALAHTIQNQVEAAYRRGDALERRRQMMTDWSRFLFPVQ